MGSAAVARPALSVAISTLAPGTYQVTDLYSGQAAGTVAVDAQGAFSNWSSSLPALEANQTWILRLAKQTGTSTTAKSALAVALYPNPARTQARLQVKAPPAGPAQVRVFDLTGRLLHTATFTGAAHTLDTSSWAAGIYFVRVQAGAAVFTQQLVVAR